MSNKNITCIPCGLHTPSRNTYYNGKLLVERDFTDEQIYHISKQQLTNHLLHGTGTVCGLRIKAHPAEECRNKFVIIEPGMALDCCGREIIVPEKKAIPVADLITQQELVLDGSQDLFITLCYKEEAAEMVPVILPDCDCSERGLVPNRIHESYEFKLFAETPGSREEIRPPIKPKIEWEHTITLSEQSPRALAVDDQFQQVYVAALAAEGGARVYVYRKDNHDLITALNGGSDPYDLVVSDSGELIYLATAGLSIDGADQLDGIAIFRESEIRDEVEPAAVIELDEPLRLVLSPRSGALFALKLTSGELIAWSEEEVTNWLGAGGVGLPANAHMLSLGSDFSAVDGAARRGNKMLEISADGRFLFVIDPNASTTQAIKVVNIAKLFANELDALINPALPGVDSSEQIVAINVSLDGQYIYLLSRIEQVGEQYARARRFQWDSTNQAFFSSGRGGQWSGQPRDIALAPNEKWAYVLQTTDSGEDVQNTVTVISVDDIASAQGGDLVNPTAKSLSLAGDSRYERLTGLGQKLYVAADDANSEDQPDRGLVAVIYIEEADCGELFYKNLDGCTACDDASGDHCVILAHLPLYQPGQKMQDPEVAGADDVVIDNYTYRPIVPSTSNITEVIRCMLEEGFASGVPGPRGPAGEQGSRGPGITAVSITTLDGVGAEATAVLQQIEGDEEGDQRLLLGIPRGQNGEQGSRGPGITAVSITTLDGVGTEATAVLQQIEGDEEGDQRLLLGIPKGEKGDPGEVKWPNLTHIVALSWIHDKVSFNSIAVLEVFLKETGLVIAFDNVVKMSTIIREGKSDKDSPGSLVFQMLSRQTDGCWCPVEGLICEAVEVKEMDQEGRIVMVDLSTVNVKAVRLRLPKEAKLNIIHPIVKVEFYADFVLDTKGWAVDGNHIGGGVPSVPSGNGMPGGTFYSWFEIEF